MPKSTLVLLAAFTAAALLSSCAHEPRSAAAGSSGKPNCDRAADLAVQAGCNEEARGLPAGPGLRRGFGNAASAADFGYVH